MAIIKHQNEMKFYGGLVVLLLLILSLVITITINAYPVYMLEMKRLALAETLGLSQEQLMHNYHQMMTYLNLPWVNTFHLDDFIHSESGDFHFYEVKKWFMLNYSVLIITIIPSILFVKDLLKTGNGWRLVRPFQFLTMLPLVLAFLVITMFDQLFIVFHRLFFNNDDWLFDPLTDPIINALPESYFMWCFILGVILFEIFLFIGVYVGKNNTKKLSL